MDRLSSLKDTYTIEVVNLREQRFPAEGAQFIATQTLIKKLPVLVGGLPQEPCAHNNLFTAREISQVK